MAAGVGLAVGAAGYGVAQQNLTRTQAAGVLGAGGLVAGALASSWKPGVGAAIVGGGAALAAGLLIAEYYAQKEKPPATAGLQAVYRQRANARAQQMRAAGGYPAMAAVSAPIGRDRQMLLNGMGAVDAPIGRALSMQLSGLA